MATESTPFPFDPGLLDDVIEGRRVGAAAPELTALAALAAGMRRLRPAGPGMEQRVRMTERFSQIVSAGRAPGLWGFFGLGYAGRRLAQRMAAGALLLSAAGGVTDATTGVSPVDLVQGTADLAGNVVTNLNPNRDPGSGPSATPTDDPTEAPSSQPTAAASATPAPVQSPAPTATPESDPETQTFTALQAGSVTLERSGTNLTVVSATPNQGWSVEIDRASGPDVEVSFTSGATEVRFEAVVVNGAIVTDVEERPADGSGSGSGSDDDDNSGPGSGDDDGGDDD